MVTLVTSLKAIELPIRTNKNLFKLYVIIKMFYRLQRDYDDSILFSLDKPIVLEENSKFDVKLPEHKSDKYKDKATLQLFLNNKPISPQCSPNNTCIDKKGK